MGSEPLDTLSHRIFESYGPSGANKVLRYASLTLGSVTKRGIGLPQEYLYQLVKAVKELSSASLDSHLEALEVPVSSKRQSQEYG